jgi:hypothetical protein
MVTAMGRTGVRVTDRFRRTDRMSNHARNPERRLWPRAAEAHISIAAFFVTPQVSELIRRKQAASTRR